MFLICLQFVLVTLFPRNLFYGISSDQKAGTAGDFFAGFLLGGAVLGTLAYFFAPQVLIFIYM